MTGSLLFTIASAATLTVPTDYATIAEAVDAAGNLDVIHLEPGVYDESVVVDHKHVLFEGDGPGLVQWNGVSANALRIQGEVGVQVRGITMSNPGGRCIRADDFGFVQVIDSVLTSCHASGNGGAILAEDAWLDVRRSIFLSNSAPNGGHISSRARMRIVQSEFYDGNAGNDGGAIEVDVDDRFEVTLSIFEGNHAGDGGGAIAAEVDDESYAIGSRFRGNTAGGNGGAVRAEGFSWFDIYFSDFCGNMANGDGGAVFHDAPYSYVHNTSFVRNSAEGAAGGVYYVENDDDLLWHNVFLENVANAQAGGLLTEEDPWVWNSIFVGNVPNGWHALDPNTPHDHNIFGTSDQLFGLPLDATELVEDPLFIEPGTGCDYDLRLADGSPGIDAGDQDGDWDIDGSPPDIGVYGGPASPDADEDGDGTPAFFDCDEGDPDVSLATDEVCNGQDDNCDGLDDDSDLVDLSTMIPLWDDDDEDGFGDPDEADYPWCFVPDGLAGNGDDCDDFDPDVHPGQPEICDGIDNDCDPATPEPGGAPWWPDVDGDGYGDSQAAPLTTCTPPPGYVANDADCDDATNAVNIDAIEVCNGIDDNCDGAIDEGAATSTWYRDSDGDGYGDLGTTVQACGAPAGFVDIAGDCDDDDPDTHPDAAEICNGVDDDCDDDVDEQLPQNVYHRDHDGDGWGGPDTVADCSPIPPGGYVPASMAGDCADGEPTVHPGRAEVCNGADDDCDDEADEGLPTLTYYDDADGDGFGDQNAPVGSCSLAPPPGTSDEDGDCDDEDAAIHPDAPEVCDGVDQDCDGAVDQGLPTTPYYVDLDEDGFGAGNPVASCEVQPPPGFAATDDDCDDSDHTVYPDAPETCDPVDRNCDGNDVLGAVDALVWYFDGDGDGYGLDALSQIACVAPPDHVPEPGDCNDGNDAVHPDADEVCNDVDDDCNGTVDDNAIDTTTFYVDQDGDAHGDASDTVAACDRPAGYAVLDDDCDDAAPSVYPGAPELCDLLDNDCNGAVDDDVIDVPFYVDDDEDGYGASGSVPTLACTAPAGMVANDGDCDDLDGTVSPNAVETCDGIDTNCSGDEADAVDPHLYFTDADGDGWGDASFPVFACEPPADATTTSGDCDDLDPANFPGNTEVCDGLDNNCNGVVDADASNAPTWREDADGDGYGTTLTVTSCDAPLGFGAVPPGDCDDTQATVFPDAPELCDGLDNDCDGLGDADDPDGPAYTAWFPDLDDDGHGAGEALQACAQPAGHAASDLDCDDSRDDVYPGAPEPCTGIDNDCDGTVENESGYVDADRDGFGAAGTEPRCNEPGLVANADDCDDDDASVNPEATEIPDNLIDEDCDGQALVPDEELTTTRAPTLWYCATADAAGWGPLLVLLPLVVRRRR